MWKPAVLGFSVVFGIGMIIVVIVFADRFADRLPRRIETREPSLPEPPPPTFKVTAVDLGIEFFQGPPNTAQQKYRRRVIAVTGRIQGIDPRRTPTIELQSVFVAADVPGVIYCKFPARWSEAVDECDLGQWVTITGTCQGRTGVDGILMTDCRLSR